jgi:hypothetical protein
VIGKGKPARLGPKVNTNEWAGATWVQVHRCATHGKFRVLPAFLLPNKHHPAELVDEGIASRVEGLSLNQFCDAWGLLDGQAPARWLRSFAQNLSSIRVWVSRQLQTLGAPNARAPDSSWDFAEVWWLLGRLQEVCQSRKLGHFARSHFVWVSGDSLPAVLF